MIIKNSVLKTPYSALSFPINTIYFIVLKNNVGH